MGSTQDLIDLGILQDPDIRELGGAMAAERERLADERGTPELSEDLPNFSPFARIGRALGAVATSPFRLLPGRIGEVEGGIPIGFPRGRFDRSFAPGGAEGEARLSPEETAARTDTELALLRARDPRGAAQTLEQLGETGRTSQVERTRLRGKQPAAPHEQVAGRIVRLPLEEGQTPEVVTDLPPDVLTKNVIIDGKLRLMGVSGDRKSVFFIPGPGGEETALEQSGGQTINVGPFDLSKPAQAELEKRIISDAEVRDNLNVIRASFEPKFFRRPERVKLFAQNFLVKNIGASFLDQESIDNIAAATTLDQAMSINLNRLVKAITGAQMSAQEAIRIGKETALATDNEVQAATKLRNQLILIDLSLARSLILRNQGINEGIATLLSRGQQVPTLDSVATRIVSEAHALYSNALIRMTSTTSFDDMQEKVAGLPEVSQQELFDSAWQEATDTIEFGNEEEGLPAWKIKLDEIIEAQQRGLLL